MRATSRRSVRSAILPLAVAWLSACCPASCQPQHDHQTWTAYVQHQGRNAHGRMQGASACGVGDVAVLKARALHRACHALCNQIDRAHPDACDDACTREGTARYECRQLTHAHEERQSPVWIDLH